MLLDSFNLLGFRHTQLEIPIIFKNIYKITLNYNFCLSIASSLVNCIFIQSPVTFIAQNHLIKCFTFLLCANTVCIHIFKVKQNSLLKKQALALERYDVIIIGTKCLLFYFIIILLHFHNTCIKERNLVLLLYSICRLKLILLKEFKSALYTRAHQHNSMVTTMHIQQLMLRTCQVTIC